MTSSKDKILLRQYTQADRDDSSNSVCLVTYGCPKNLVEGENLLGLLKKKGFGITADLEKADYAVIHTCSFIADAKKESTQAIKALSKLRSEGSLKKLIVTGCLVQEEKQKAKALFPEVDVFLGTGQLENIMKHIDEPGACVVSAPGGYLEPADGRVLSSPLPVSYLRLAEGCGHKCSFCIIPKLRGGYKSRTKESLLEEARLLAGQGIKELVLIAQDTTFYGADLYGKPALAQLIRKLGDINSLKWIRLMYAYPNTVTKELVAAIKDTEKACKYIDIPLQHVSNRVLRNMRRPLDAAKTVYRIKEQCPDMAVRSTFITGFPGETDKDFRELYDFVSEGLIDQLGVFSYSDNALAASSKMKPAVSAKTADERNKALMLLQQKVADKKNRARIGQKHEVLVEYKHGRSLYLGRAAFQAPEIDSMVVLKGDFKPGGFEKITIKGVQGYDLTGTK